MKKIIKPAAALLVIAVTILGSLALYRSMVHYSGPAAEDTKARQEKENAINGQWQATEDIVCDIYRDERGLFHGLVTITEGSDVVSFFEASGSWRDDLNGFKYTDGKKVSNSYLSNGNIESETVYENGKGSFIIKDGNVYWDDGAEHIAAGMPFEYVGEY